MCLRVRRAYVQTRDLDEPMYRAEPQRTPSVRTNRGFGGAHALRGTTAYAERTYESRIRRRPCLALNHSVRRAYVRITGSVAPMPCAESQRTPSVRTNHGFGGAHALRGVTAYAERTYESRIR